MSDFAPSATSKRGLLALAVAAWATPLAWHGTTQAAVPTPIEVWKDPACDCCEGWIRHLQAAGFAVSVRDVAEVSPVKAAHGVPEALWSCHTAVVEGYVVEGHVPAADLRRLLAERPAARGLAVPGMPPSAPGMDMPGTPYEVILFGASEGDQRWARH